jgi:hypothetical protein
MANAFQLTFYVLAMVGHLKNISSTFVQMPNTTTSVEFTSVIPTIGNTMLAVVLVAIKLKSLFVPVVSVT